MAYWPKTLRGNVITGLVILIGLPIAMIAGIALSGPLVWGGLVFVALTSVALYIWRRSVEHARERAWVGAFSFGDMVESMKARQALDDPVRRRILSSSQVGSALALTDADGVSHAPSSPDPLTSSRVS